MTKRKKQPACVRCGAGPDALIHTGDHPTHCHPFQPHADASAAKARQEAQLVRVRERALAEQARHTARASTRAEEAPADLVDAVLVATVQRLDREGAHGGRVPLSEVRSALGALSEDAVVVALLDAEKRGTIELVSAGENPDPGAEWWIQRGTRGALCWAKARQP